MNNETLLNVIQAYRADCVGNPGDALSNERASALDRFHGRPYGDEETGSSQVVSMDLAETVEWILPPIIETFIAGGELGQFRPIDEDDEKGAKQETDYINHVIMKDNEGFITVHDVVQDCLLLKNGYYKHGWDETEKTRETEYKDLTEDGLAQLFQELGITDPENEFIEDKAELGDGTKIEILGQDERERTTQTDMGPIVETVFTLKLRITRKKNKTSIMANPTEQVRVHKSCTGSLQQSPFSEHFTEKSRTELIQMGMDKDFVNGLTAVNSDHQNRANTVSTSRESDTTNTDSGPVDSVDRSMEFIEYTEAYLMVDYDDDGVAELRKVVTVGGKIPEGDEWNEVIDSVPMTGQVAIRMAHRHEGISIDDRLKDLQRIKTTLTRQMLDNIYRTNNIRSVVNNRFHVPDLLQSLPGGHLRIDDDLPVGDAYLPIPVQSIVDKILPAIDFVDQMKGNRTGIDKFNTMQDPDVLKTTTKGAFLEGLTQASQKVRMIERMMAETGIKELFLRVHEIESKHRDKKRRIELNGEYIEVNPTEWRERTDFDVKVGLGTGTKEEKRRDLMLLAQLQQPLIDQGLVTAEKAFNFYRDIAKTLGEVNPGKYAVDPTLDENGQPSPEYAQIIEARNQPQPNPLAEAEQMKGMMKLESDKLKAQFQSQTDQLRLQFEAALAEQTRNSEAELELFKKQVEMSEAEEDRRSKENIETMKAEVALLKEGINKDLGEPGIGAELNERTFDPVSGTFV